MEQPLPVGARGGAAALREATGVPIAADEAVTSPEAAVALVEHGAADVLVVKPHGSVGRVRRRRSRPSPPRQACRS